MNDESIPNESILGILRSAIEIEKYGIEYYNALSTAVDDVIGKEFLKYLAEAERIHQRTLEEQYENRENSDADAIQPLPMDNLDEDGKQLIFSIPLEDYDPSTVSATDALKFGIHVEEQSMKFYNYAAKIVNDDELKNILKDLVEFEKEHMKLLKENLKILESNGDWLGKSAID
jgi:rubrerythrin